MDNLSFVPISLSHVSRLKSVCSIVLLIVVCRYVQEDLSDVVIYSKYKDGQDCFEYHTSYSQIKGFYRGTYIL